MSSCELVAFVNVLACAIAKCTPKEEVPLIAAIFGQLASTLATITVQEELLAGNEVKATPINAPDSEILITLPRQ
jgi:hypothetical protein